jgi:hypothetical protein
MMRRIGGYRIDGVGQDWDLFLRMAERGRVANLPKILYLNRLHRQSNAWKTAKKSCEVMITLWPVRAAGGKDDLNLHRSFFSKNGPGVPCIDG